MILYALGIGASEEELDFVYEKNLKIIPTFGTIPCFNTIKNEPQRPMPYPASEILADYLRKEAGKNVNGLHMSLDFRYYRPMDAVKGTLLYEDKIEHIYDWGSKGVVITTLGVTVAKEMIFTSKHYTAEEAKKMGFVSKVVEPEELMEACEALMGQIVKQAPIAVKYSKIMCNNAAEMSLEVCLEHERLIASIMQTSKDFAEGVTAFKEKRDPVFKNK